MGTDSIKFTGNQKKNCNTVFKLGKRISNLDTINENSNNLAIDSRLDARLNNLKKTKPFSQIKKPGKDQIHITEWGPYDFGYPLLSLKNIDSTGLYHFEVLTPSINPTQKTGNWKLKTVNGFNIIQNTNNQITAKADSSVAERFIQLEYNGPSFTGAFGKTHPANKQYIFQYKEFDPHFNWNIHFYIWDSTNDPQKNYAVFAQSLQKPVYSTTQPAIDYTWWGAIGKDLPVDSFATVATSTVQLKEGDYLIGITADDLAKVIIDGKEIIDAWDASYTALDENTHHEKTIHLNAGSHEFKIVHADINGLATLMFYMQRQVLPPSQK